MKSKRFQKAAKSILITAKPQQLFGLVAETIAVQVEGPRGIETDRIESASFPAQVVYWLWRFACEAGLNGYDVFLLNHLGIYAPQVHASLEVVGATELVRRMEAAIPHAMKAEGVEFKRLKDRSWFEQFAVNPEFNTLESVNADVWPIIGDLTENVEVFIRENADELFEL